MPVVQPTKVACRACSVKGVSTQSLTSKITVYETMCKPYITATVDIKDSANLINPLKLKYGDPVSFVIDAGLGKLYESNQYILTVDEQPDPNDFRNILYSITTATISYFNDRAGLVQRADINIPATAAAGAIHSQYVGTDAPLNLISASLGMISKIDAGGFVTSNKKPFKAIQDILDRCAYPGFKTGSSVYFRNAEEYVMGPLEQIFATMGSQQHFVQKHTWGAHWQDTFDSYNAVIRATAKVTDKGSNGTPNTDEAAKGMLNLFDIKMGQEASQNIGQLAAGALTLFGSGSKMGGIPNILQMNTRRNELSTEQQLNIVAENMFRAQVKSSANYFIKVPVQTGFNVTVGRGFTADLLPAEGTAGLIGGLMLAADVVHECCFIQDEVQGTTNIRGVQLN